MSSEERRQYFRIRNWLIIKHDLVSDSDEEPPLGEQSPLGSPRITLLRELNRIDNENKNYLGSLTDKNSQLGSYLLNLNKKVELITQFMVQSLETEENELTEVDISGGGVRFTSNEARKIDQLIRMEIVLIPDCVGLIAIGRVVDCKPASAEGQFELAVIFVRLREKDRDAIIRHVFRVQSEQLRDDSLEVDKN